MRASLPLAGPAALAAAALAVFRLACDSSAAAWTFTNSVARIEGFSVGWLTGRPLLIGASFGGLDFLVLMAALTVAWLMHDAGTTFRTRRWAMLFILLAQAAYLVVLAFSHDLAALLPPQVAPVPTAISHLGIWTWGNAIRMLLPWNLPVLAAVFHSAAAVGIFHLTAWQTTPHDLADESNINSADHDHEYMVPEGKRRNRSLQGEPALPLDGRNSLMTWRRFAPAGLLIVAAVAMTLSPVRPDLKGRRIVAYDDGTTDWSTADPGTVPPGQSPRYGLLPALVESLGGQFIAREESCRGRSPRRRRADHLAAPPAASSR